MISDDVTTIRSERLDLVLMTPDFLRAVIARDWARAREIVGLDGVEQLEPATSTLEMRLKQIEEEPSVQEWLLRRIVLRETGEFVGHIGFHTAPNAEYLLELGLSGVEYGYTVYPKYRRRGIAKEAAGALMAWAHERHKVATFVLSIAPDNVPSIAIAKHFRFRKVSSHIDPVDGLEYIYTLEYEG